MYKHTHRFSPNKMHLLDSPERRKLMPPEQLLNLGAIQTNDTIVDLGAGTGYFSIPAAEMTDGTVYAVDVETKMLEVVKQRAHEQGLTNVIPMPGLIEEVPLRDGMADVVIASLVLHAVQPLSKGLQEIHRILNVNGKLLCVEFEPKESHFGPPMKLRISSQAMEDALNVAGFSVTRRLFPTEFIYMFVATKLT